MKKLFLILFTVSIFLISCEKDNGPETYVPTLNDFVGTWKGNEGSILMTITINEVTTVDMSKIQFSESNSSEKFSTESVTIESQGSIYIHASFRIFTSSQRYWVDREIYMTLETNNKATVRIKFSQTNVGAIADRTYTFKKE